MEKNFELIPTLPATAAQKAVIQRSRQLTDFKWTPKRDVPTYYKKENTVLPEGREVCGFPYASTELKDKFFSENVSFETFLSAIPNPYSKLYQPGQAAFNACSYGVVCNGLVRYALGIRRRVSTAKWLTIPGMRIVAKREDYSAEDIMLCDILYAYGEGRNHVSLITNILRTKDGKVAEIEVSEAVRPTCKRACYTPEEFFEKFKLFSLCRYEHLESVPPLDEQIDDMLWNSGIERVRPKISVDNGNRSNYLVGETVLLSVCAGRSDKILLYRDGELIESIAVSATAVIPRNLGRGYYKAVLEEDGAFVEFCVNKAKLTYTVTDGIITVKADSCDKESTILYADFRQAGVGCASLAKYEELTDGEKRSGEFSRHIPEDAENFKIYFENKYGVWTHPMTRINK